LDALGVERRDGAKAVAVSLIVKSRENKSSATTTASNLIVLAYVLPFTVDDLHYIG
jgi:hypothetical protein